MVNWITWIINNLPAFLEYYEKLDFARRLVHNLPMSRRSPKAFIPYQAKDLGPKPPKWLQPKTAVVASSAEKVVNKFGGPNALAYVMKILSEKLNDPKYYRDKSVIRRWQYNKRIPAQVLKYVLTAAWYAGIVLTDDDLKDTTP